MRLRLSVSSGILLLIILFNFNPLTKVQAESAEDQIGAMVRHISDKSDINVSSQDFSDLHFKKGKDVNLYLILLNEYGLKSKDKAIDGLAAVTGYSQINLRDYVYDNKTYFLEDPSGSIQGTQDEAENLRITFAEEQGMFQTLAYLENQTLALELFSNGNNRDAEFDLLDDFNKIEKLLFARNAESQFGESITFDFSSASDLASSDFQFGSGGLTGGSNSNSGSDTEDDHDPETETETPPEDNPAACQVDDNLSGALDDFENTATPDEDPTTTSDDADTVAQNNTNPKSGFSSKLLKPFTETDPRCTTADVIFGDLFCIRVEKIYTTAESYFINTDDCVACEIEKIAKLSNELVSESLTPHKITGNFGEPALCKTSLFNSFSININFVPRPAQPDLAISLPVTELTPEELAGTYRKNAATPDREAITENALRRGTTLGEQTLQGVQDLSDIISANLEQESAIENLMNASAPSTETNAVLIELLNQRLLTFNLYFDNFLTILRDINDNLNAISAKPQCTLMP